VKARSPKENTTLHKGVHFKRMALGHNNSGHRNSRLVSMECLVYLGSQSWISKYNAHEPLLQQGVNSGSLFVSGVGGKNFVPCDLEGLFPRADAFRDMLGLW